MRRKKRKFLWGSILVLILSMGALFIIARFIVTPIVFEEAVNKAILHVELIEEELNTKLSEKNVLTRNIATIASALPLRRDAFLEPIGSLIKSSEGVAGGGIWPEPGKMVSGIDKASLFWAKDGTGQYQLDEGYNLSESSPYYYDFWYQSAKSSPEGQCVWSHAYIDPHSKTPMVTCSVRIDRNGEFWGVATIDVELSDIHQRLAEINKQSGIYSFILDDSDQIVASSIDRDFSMIMRTLDDVTMFDFSLLPLLDAVNHDESLFTELGAGVVASEGAILVTSELVTQGWRIGVIFPDSVAKEKVNLLSNYLYAFVILVAVVFTIVIALTTIIGFWNYLLVRKVKLKSKQLHDISFKDNLTGLSSQLALHAELEQRITHAKDTDSKFAILFIDLDDFKKLNNRFGISGADCLLRFVAQRLSSAVRESDFICRFGADEFVVVTRNAHTKYDIESVCAHLLNAMKEPFSLDGNVLNITMSIGIACYYEDGKQVNELLRNASIAMREAKDRTCNSFNFSSKSMHERTLRKMAVEEQLSGAIDRQEISVAFQPIVDLSNGKPKKFEALARWTNPSLGVVAPYEFIELAEHNGFIIELGEYLLERALETCARLRKAYGQDYVIAVNVSPKQFNDPMFATHVLDILRQYQLPTSCLTLEITEGVLINSKDKSDLIIQQLVDSGIKLAMDDFGTGYSSLSYVRHYPFDILKIDKEFVDDVTTEPKSIRLVETVLAMAKSLNIDVVAEGIEVEEQAEILKSKGCQYGQGYLFSRPLNEKDLENWLLTKM